MKFKFFALAAILFTSNGVNAMILTTGETVDRKTVTTVVNAIDYLKKEDMRVLSLALHACEKYHGNINNAIDGTPDFYRERNRSIESLAKAQILKIADAQGNISQDACNVLYAALLPAFRKAPNSAPSPGFFWGIRNPISYRNWSSWDYWFPKK